MANQLNLGAYTPNCFPLFTSKETQDSIRKQNEDTLKTSLLIDRVLIIVFIVIAIFQIYTSTYFGFPSEILTTTGLMILTYEHTKHYNDLISLSNQRRYLF